MSNKKAIFIGLFDMVTRYYDWRKFIRYYPDYDIITLNRFYEKYPDMSPDIIFQTHAQNINYEGTTSWQENYKPYMDAQTRIILGVSEPLLPNAEVMDWDKIYTILPIERDTSSMVEILTWCVLNGYKEVRLTACWMMDRIESGELAKQLPDMVWACKYYPKEYGMQIIPEGGLLMLWENVLSQLKLRWDEKPNKPIVTVDWRNIRPGLRPYWDTL